MHTRIEDFSKITPEALVADINHWLSGLAMLSRDLVRLSPTLYSDISAENPLAGGKLHPMGRSAYGIPPVFRLMAIPSGNNEFDHLRSTDGHDENITKLFDQQPNKYDFDLHGVRAYTHEAFFENGIFIDVRPNDDEQGGLGATISTPVETTQPTVGLPSNITDSIHIPLRKLDQVEFKANRLSAQMVQERKRL